MPQYGLSIFGLDRDKTAIACGRDLRISPKHSREICRELKGLSLEAANKYLDAVIEKKRAIPFRRHYKKTAHRSDITTSSGNWHSGRYPVKACKEFKKIFENLENNAIFKNLDTEKLRIVHLVSQRARKITGIYPRAHGRATPNDDMLTHIEAVAEEI